MSPPPQAPSACWCRRTQGRVLFARVTSRLALLHPPRARGFCACIRSPSVLFKFTVFALFPLVSIKRLKRSSYFTASQLLSTTTCNYCQLPTDATLCFLVQKGICWRSRNMRRGMRAEMRSPDCQSRYRERSMQPHGKPASTTGKPRSRRQTRGMMLIQALQSPTHKPQPPNNIAPPARASALHK